MADISINDVINLIKNNNIGNLTEKEKSEYIDKILEVLSDEKNKLDSQHPHYPILTEDFLNESLFKILNNLIDLDLKNNTDGTEDYLDHLSTGQWNESVNELINILKNKILKKDAAIKTFNKNTDKEVSFTQNDIIEANAGNSFNNSSPYVIKNKNVDGDTYTDVRNTDKIDSVLNKRSRLQFTHSQTVDRPISDYIRLLMPKYTRRVEVEDLNRNFWVIGQTIAGISMYLFDDDSPMKKMFKYLSSEIVQLWENLIYLWALLKILSAKPKYDTKYLVVYLPNDNQNNQLKYDNFEPISITGTVSQKLTKCGQRLKYLIDQYHNCNLYVLPIVRKGNYWHNYYTTEEYYGVLKYNRETASDKNWTELPFPNAEVFNINTDKGALPGVRLLNATKIRYINFNNVDSQQTTPVDDEKSLYFCAIRIEPSLFLDNQNNLIVGLVAKDAFGQLVNSTVFSNEVQLTYSNGAWDKTEMSTPGPDWPTSFTDVDKRANISSVYLGEVISNFSISKKKVTPEPIPPQTGGFKVFSIGSFFPSSTKLNTLGGNNNFQLPQLSTGKKFNVDTYGYGAYLHYNENGNAFTSHDGSGELFFYKNIGFQEGGNLPSNTSSEKYVYKLSELTNFNEKMKNWGKEYLTKLVNKTKNSYKGQGSESPIGPGLYISRIGAGYWSGYNGTVWNNGIFCDLFAVFKNEKQQLVVQHVCPLYMFDGYWTNNTTVFTYENGAQWRQLKMTATGVKIIQEYDSQHNPVYKFQIEGGLLSWQDHNYDMQHGVKPQNDRPHCKFTLSYDEYNKPNITFTGRNAGKYSLSDNELNSMTSLLDPNTPIKIGHTNMQGGFYNFTYPTSGRTTIIGGAYDWANYNFA